MKAIQSMSDVGKCYDNCRMESFFATLKKEKLYQLDTMKMTMEEVKTEVWRFVQYYNRTRICTFNEGGDPPVVYREKVAASELKTAAQNKIQVFQDCTIIQGKRILMTFKINTKQSIVFKNLKKHQNSFGRKK